MCSTCMSDMTVHRNRSGVMLITSCIFFFLGYIVMNGSRWTIPHATVHERREQFGVQTMELFQSHSINLRCATEEEIFVGIVQTLNKN